MIAAEQYATRLVVPASQRMPATRWSSHKDIAAKALRKLAGPHLPASLTKLEQAVKRAHAAYDKAERAPASASARERRAATTSVDDEPGRRARRRRVAGPARRGPTRRPSVARPGGRAGGGRSARAPGAGHRPEEADDVPSLQPSRRSPTPSAPRAAKPTATASSRPRARCLPARAGSAGSRSAPPTASRATASRNQWLIAVECHARGITPTYVAGFRAFLALNRCVRKGEKAIKILAPVAVKQRDDDGEETGEKRIFFRTVPVFDTFSRDRWEEHRGSRCSRLLAGGLSGWKGRCCRERLVRTKRGP